MWNRTRNEHNLLAAALLLGIYLYPETELNLFSFVGVVNDTVIFGTVDGANLELARQKLEAQLKLREWQHCRFSLQQLTQPFQMNAVKKAMFDDKPAGDAPLG